MRNYHLDGTSPCGTAIFVFGSNLAGIHGAGAAKVARLGFGAATGCGVGPTGRSYAIPTKDGRRGGPALSHPDSVLPLDAIAREIHAFIRYARENPQETFFVTRVGCGLAGYKDSVIAPLFRDAPSNCSFPSLWSSYLEP